ncbi:hypothetical protein HCN44_007220 [Aphidius gifuensis]|uniref:Uncharacterized protein n=1 Tax=Aphidius gifuensis TaxID=684658 RepID=A0A835CQ83_APHGI|nr:hypothetical protein HCN44_007220 [Aphidius gifuensis]
MEERNDTDQLGRGKRIKSTKRFSYPPTTTNKTSSTQSKVKIISNEKLLVTGKNQAKNFHKVDSIQKSDAAAFNLIQRKRKLEENANSFSEHIPEFSNMQKCKKTSGRLVETRAEIHHAPEQLDEFQDNVDLISPDNSFETRSSLQKVKKVSLNKNLSKNSFCSNTVNENKEIQLLREEKENLLTRNFELEASITDLKKDNELLRIDTVNKNKELTELKEQINKQNNTDYFPVELREEIASQLDQLRDNFREDLALFGDQLHEAIVKDVINKEQLHESQIQIIDNKVIITENISMDIDKYMKAAQAHDMRKRANIVMSNIWTKSELMKLVAKKNPGENRKTITADDVLVVQNILTNMQKHKNLDASGTMSLTNIRNWISYRAKMCRTNDQKIKQEQVDDDGRRENQRVIEVEQRLRVKLIAQYAEMNKKKLELDHQALLHGMEDLRVENDKNQDLFPKQTNRIFKKNNTENLQNQHNSGKKPGLRPHRHDLNVAVILSDRFENKRLMVQSHFERLHQLPQLKERSAVSMQQLMKFCKLSS